MDARLRKTLLRAGFTEAQAEALHENFALSPHEHTADQITDFDEAVREVESEEDEEE